MISVAAQSVHVSGVSESVSQSFSQSDRALSNASQLTVTHHSNNLISQLFSQSDNQSKSLIKSLKQSHFCRRLQSISSSPTCSSARTTGDCSRVHVLALESSSSTACCISARSCSTWSGARRALRACSAACPCPWLASHLHATINVLKAERDYDSVKT